MGYAPRVPPLERGRRMIRDEERREWGTARASWRVGGLVVSPTSAGGRPRGAAWSRRLRLVEGRGARPPSRRATQSSSASRGDVTARCSRARRATSGSRSDGRTYVSGSRRAGAPRAPRAPRPHVIEPDDGRRPRRGGNAGRRGAEGQVLLRRRGDEDGVQADRAPRTARCGGALRPEGDRVELGQTPCVRVRGVRVTGGRQRDARRPPRRSASSEVGPRDGLQNEKRAHSDRGEGRLRRRALRGGVRRDRGERLRLARSGSRSSPTPRRLRAHPARRGGRRLLRARPERAGASTARSTSHAGKVAVFTAASETFNRKNINASIEESIERFTPVVPRAPRGGPSACAATSRRRSVPLRGAIAPDGRARASSQRLLDLGVDEISIGDTIGKPRPLDVHALLDVLLDASPRTRVVAPLPRHVRDGRGERARRVRRGVTAFDATAAASAAAPSRPARRETSRRRTRSPARAARDPARRGRGAAARGLATRGAVPRPSARGPGRGSAAVSWPTYPVRHLPMPTTPTRPSHLVLLVVALSSPLLLARPARADAKAEAERLANPDKEVRAAAAEALAKMGVHARRPCPRSRRRSETGAAVRYWAAVAVGGLGERARRRRGARAAHEGRRMERARRRGGVARPCAARPATNSLAASSTRWPTRRRTSA